MTHINKQCTSDCRRVGCPEEDLCPYCFGNKWEDREKHIEELARFLQKKVEECKEAIENITD